jgi:CheY-like chemotaxis protein
VTELDEAFSTTHPGVTPGTFVTLAVADTGIGMNAETRERVFEPFFTTREEGTGLGLATVYGIVKQHGGNVWVESEPGRGTTFRCHFPANEDGTVEAEAEAEVVPAAEGSGETIMVVEDEAAVRNLAVDLLERHGYSVFSAKDGEDCLAFLEGYDGPLDLVLTDVIMPGLKGPALFSVIALRFPDAKVLYMSGYTDDLISHHGVLEDGIAFIQKPFSVHQLTTKVREALEASGGTRR